MARKWIFVLFCAVAGLGSTVALRISLSNDRRLDAALLELSDKAEEEIAPRTKPRATTKAILPKSASLRQRFVDLAAERAKRMNDEELSQAVDEITKALADQDAAAETELEKAAEQLKAVADKFPGTPAGERANRALEELRARPVKPDRKPRSVDIGEDEVDLSDPFDARKN